MENKEFMGSMKKGFIDQVPSLVRYITSKGNAGFDTVSSPRAEAIFGEGSAATSIHSPASVINMPSQNSLMQESEFRWFHSISISLPASPSSFRVEQSKRVLLGYKTGTNAINGQPSYPLGKLQEPKHVEFHSQPLSTGLSRFSTTTEGKVSDPMNIEQRLPRNDRLKDRRFDSFKTWSGKLERQLSNLRGNPQDDPEITEPEPVPGVDRYFDALEGPELETLRVSEELVLPEDKKWPFLLRFPISSFGMCLGVSSQAMLWKTLATSPSTKFLHISPMINLVLWCISLALMITVTLVYTLKIIFYFEAVRREYYHPIRINFFFAPWIACLFLSIGVPPLVAENLHYALWYVFMAPIFVLELKIYGQWMSGGQRRLSKVANPSNHLSVVGNFVGALLGASMGLKDGPIFFFAVGLAHYFVLFITLYQRLPTNETLPKDLHPVFFLFVAAPSVACMAWAKITGDFSYGSKIAYFIALFLYVSLVVRVNFFRGFRFSLSWWAYTFPMTGASLAAIRYAAEVKNISTQALCVALSVISTLTVAALLVSTIFHAFVLHDLFPNDISIAITERKSRSSSKKRRHLGSLISDAKDIEICVSAEDGMVF